MFSQCRHRAGRGASVPQLRGAAPLGMLPVLAPGSQDTLPCRPGEPVGSLRDGDGPFGVLAQSKARHAQGRSFLLDASGVREYDRGSGHQVQKIQVAQRIQQADALPKSIQAGGFQLLTRPRVDRENEKDFAGDLRQGGKDFRQAASTAKYAAVSVAREVGIWSADIFGAASVILEHPIHKFPMDAWAASLGEGTQDVQKLVIFREIMRNGRAMPVGWEPPPTGS